MNSYLFPLLLVLFIGSCANSEQRSTSLASINDPEFQNLKMLISAVKAKADLSAKHSGTGIKAFKIRSFKQINGLGTLCEAVSQDQLVEQFVNVLTSPFSLDEKAVQQPLIDATELEIRDFVVKIGDPAQHFLCLNGGVDQHGTSVDEIYTFVFALHKPANFVISRTTLSYID